ncbi:MAG: alpha/beta fold hydrolase [Gemmatimonadaceae bacterium]|nr:alpha/beta fold hydrolase [Gemmatimonadaceae bacterium]
MQTSTRFLARSLFRFRAQRRAQARIGMSCGALVATSLLAACGGDGAKGRDSVAVAQAKADSIAAAAKTRPPLDAGETMQPVGPGNVWARVRGLGPGVPMVLIQGAPGTGSFALKAFDAIGEDRVVVRYDLLGTGKSDTLANTDSVNIRNAASELESLRRAMKIERWTVVGHSYGAAIAVAYAKMRPHDVLGVVLINPLFDAASDSSHSLSTLRTLVDTTKYAADLDSLTTMPGSAVDAALRRSLGDSIRGGLTVEQAARVLREQYVPTMIISGAKDVAGAQAAKVLAKAVPKATVKLYPEAGAFSLWQTMDQTRDDVRAFLNKIEPPKR